MAGGATIDHIIAVTVLLTAMLLAMMTFNGLFAQALEYDSNRQVANKAVDLINTICLSPGSPPNWGSTNVTVSSFGLQDPDVGGYSLSPYSLMRLNTASDDSELVYYDETGLYYNNISTNYGNAILTPIGACVNYTTVADLLGISGKYGFSVDIIPTLTVNVTEVNNSPLTLNVEVKGSGLPISGATVKYFLFHIEKVENGETTFPIINYDYDVTETRLSGSVEIPFDITAEGEGLAYSFTAYVDVGGVSGVGYFTSNTISEADQYIVPLVRSFDSDEDLINLYLTHSYNILPLDNNAAAHYNASFFILTSDFYLQEYKLENSTGLLNTGSKLYNTTSIPGSETGILVISFMANGRLGSVIVPWGTGALGVPVAFNSGGVGFSGYNFVATEIRQVIVDGISYQVKVSVWKLGD